VTTRGTEPAPAAVVGPVFDLHGLRGRPDPATEAADETKMQMAVPRQNLAFPLLPMQVEVRGRGDLGVELRRRVLHFNVTEHPTAAWTAQQCLDTFPDDSAPSYLLRDRDSMYDHAFRQRKVYGRIIGYPELKPHDLRHGVAMEVLEEHHDLEQVRALLGHARIDTTQVYTSIRPAQLKRAVLFYEEKALRMLSE